MPKGLGIGDDGIGCFGITGIVGRPQVRKSVAIGMDLRGTATEHMVLIARYQL
jgi:hypothetical protein